MMIQHHHHYLEDVVKDELKFELVLEFDDDEELTEVSPPTELVLPREINVWKDWSFFQMKESR